MGKAVQKVYLDIWLKTGVVILECQECQGMTKHEHRKKKVTIIDIE